MKMICLTVLAFVLAGCGTKVVCYPGSGGTNQRPSTAEEDSAYAQAIVIKDVKGEDDGVEAEYAWLRRNYSGYAVKHQAVMSSNGKHYDRLDFTTAGGEHKSVYFDITSFYGK